MFHLKLIKINLKDKENLNEADQWRWEMAGLLHDADWDQWPELHCKNIIEYLVFNRWKKSQPSNSPRLNRNSVVTNRILLLLSLKMISNQSISAIANLLK